MPSVYEESVVAYIRTLEQTIVVLKKGEDWAKENNVPEFKMIKEISLTSDMKDLAFQVQSMCNTAKSAISRLAKIEAPKHEDDETTFAACYQRIQKTIDVLNAADSKAFERSANEKVYLQAMGKNFPFDNSDRYMQVFGWPNFYFHATMVYAFLRMQGVPVGKLDFLTKIPAPEE